MADTETLNYLPPNMGGRHGSQASMRRSYNVTDQHGRKWLAVREKNSDGACYFTPCFTDELATPVKYLSIPDERPYTVVIDYDAWIADLEGAHRDRETRRFEIGRALYSDRFDPEAADPRELMTALGPKPVDPEVIRAKRDGKKAAPKAPKPVSA